MWPPQPPLLRPPLPSYCSHLSPLPPLPAELACRILPYLPGYGWFAGKRGDVTVDSYVEAVLKLSMWLDLHILTSVFKSMF